MLARTVLGLALLAPSGCSAKEVAAPPVNELTCAAGELFIEGTIGGTAVSIREKSTGHGFINKAITEPGILQATGSSGTFSFEFDTQVGSGQPAPARGTVRLRAPAPELDLGNCDRGPNDSNVSYTAGNPAIYRFSLKGARRPPYCTGEPVAGELNGCVGIPR